MARSRGREKAPAQNDAYTGMLIVSLLGLLTAAVLLFLDYSQYPESKPPSLPAVASPGKGGGAPAPQAPQPAPEQPPANPPMPEGGNPADPAKGGEQPKGEAPKGEAPKGEAPKGEAPKE